MISLVTGASGSVGSALVERIEGECYSTDLPLLDVTDYERALELCEEIEPTVIFHLAGAKHAPQGELDPVQVATVNIGGTLNVLEAAREVGAKVVLASTCKACDPETAYGASKLIAERMVLNEGGVVVRYFNIPEASGNVFRLWESLPEDEPLPVTDCWRYFVSMEQAVSLTLVAASLPSGRYAPEPGDPQWMPHVASRLYPGREQIRIPRRRGDRYREPRLAMCEVEDRHGEHMRISGVHDPVVELVAA